MRRKIFRSVMTAAGAVLLASILIIMGCLYDYFGAVQQRQLKAELELAAAGVEASGAEYLNALDDSNNRLTWIAADGDVLYDAQADEQHMENHAQREEVRQALANGEGQSERYSSTLLEKTVYCARRLSDGSVLRISESRATMGLLAFGMLQPMCVVLLVALVLAFFLADRLSARIIEPFNRLDLEHPLENDTYDELAPVLTRINRQRRQIDAQLMSLKQRKDEFEQITASMNEGLVLLNDSSTVLSINPAAQRLFHADAQTVGRDFLTIERGTALQEAVSRAKRDGHSELRMERDSREYRLAVSRIESDSAAAGVVILCFDVTEQSEGERMRREFTANVSHELKTPLTAILGSSELMCEGLVKSEDIPRFAALIHDEAARLLALIEDIIRLSHLDEGEEITQESVDLAAVATHSAEQLREMAEQSGVTLSVHSEACRIRGVERLAGEIAYNLIENAIKYNVDGGKVNVTVSADGVLTVSDTGIGIPPEQQARVFERFYRVDKSHSKKIGGTGLGLSIVKHACAYLGAAVSLESEPGKGTCVRVSFTPETP